MKNETTTIAAGKTNSLKANAGKVIAKVTTPKELSKEELEKVAGELSVGANANAKKPAKLSGKKTSGKKEKTGPGVIESILEFVSKAGEKGISKEVILTKLAARFPKRAKDGMSKTINVQLPNRMSRERSIKIIKNENGRFLLKEKKAKAA